MATTDTRALVRIADWETPLAAYLSKAAGEPYRYGRNDCLLHVASAAGAMTGEDPGKPHRGKYKTEAGAARRLRRFGAKSPARMMDLHFERTEPAFAQRGDAVAGEDGIPGICIGATAVFVGESGFIETPLAEWRYAWKIAR